jgi:hypothetical protein
MEIETTSPVLEPVAAQRLSTLAAILVEVMDSALTPLVQQHLPPQIEDGRYALSLRGDTVEWLIKQS